MHSLLILMYSLYVTGRDKNHTHWRLDSVEKLAATVRSRPHKS